MKQFKGIRDLTLPQVKRIINATPSGSEYYNFKEGFYVKMTVVLLRNLYHHTEYLCTDMNNITWYESHEVLDDCVHLDELSDLRDMLDRDQED